MNRLTTTLVAITAGFIFTGCQSEEQQNPQLEQSIQVINKQFSLAAVQAGDITVANIQAPSLDAINNSKDPISFVNSTPSQQALVIPQANSNSESDEFWMTVSGAELNKGVKLAISQPSSIIRIAPRADNRSGAMMQSQSISPQQLRLQKVGDKTDSTASYIQSLTDADALATAGLDDNSSALTLSSSATAGTYKLTVAQSLPKNGQYLVNVKEKGSPYKLKLSTNNRISSDKPNVLFTLQLSNSQTALQPQASLKHADGNIQSLAVEQVNGQWQATLPSVSNMPSSNAGLSEIQVNVQTQVNGQALYRTVKTAVKQYVPSGKLSNHVDSQWHDGLPSQLTFAVELQQEGRFGVNAALTGTDSAGNDILILTSQSAAWLTPESSTISLNFDTDTIESSGLKAPFKLKGLELLDQGQMARLSYQQQALTLSL
ncbi:DUF4785 domain-containing protein [Shewanella sp. 10N.286.45.A1]|uniref:DUF4785 domain-containing protein n=1 Tax=Shewanella sp. 10N.286.45.A1 TaxID=3229694 RepID=UPI003552B8B6